MSQKVSNKKFFMGITVAFMLPLSFYIVAKMMHKDQIAMPGHYYAERVDSSVADGKTRYDSVYHQVRDINLVNQLGDHVSLNQDLKGKILLLNVFFTRCGSVCPNLTSNLTIMQKAFKKNDTTVQLLSLTVDPAHDSVAALREYSERYGANSDHWWFLTGDRNDIYDYVRHELRLLATPADGGIEQLDHSQTIVLLDKDRYIRGYYNGLDTAALKHCADDIVLLSLEKKHRKR